MRRLLFLLATLSVAYGFEYDGLRVKFGWSSARANIEHSFKIPRTIAEAENEGWRRTERGGHLYEVKNYCYRGRGVCTIYDLAGFIAGLQIAFPIADFEAGGFRPEMKFNKWNAPPIRGPNGDPNVQYWTLVQYFTSEASIKGGAGPRIENGATLQDNGVWILDLNARLYRIPLNESDIVATTAFKKQNCIPNMGTHYYFNMTPEMSCEDILPWFVLVSEGQLIGTGFQMFGKLKNQVFREWFEDTPSPKSAIELTIPDAPQCMLDLADQYGMVSMHIYYVDKPWEIRCKAGDSAKPAPILDRILLNGYRYASQVTDELKKLFSG